MGPTLFGGRLEVPTHRNSRCRGSGVRGPARRCGSGRNYSRVLARAHRPGPSVRERAGGRLRPLRPPVATIASKALLQLRLAALLVSARLSLRRADTTTTLRRLTRRRFGHTRPFRPHDGMRAVRRAARVIGGDCLAQSVALTAALARANHDAVLVLGSRRYPSGEWGAHAWVRAEAQTLDPRPSGVHQPLAQLSAATAWSVTPLRGERD